MIRTLPHAARLTLAAASLTLLSAPGHAVIKRVGITSFDAIEVDGDMRVEITSSPRTGAAVEGSSRAIDTLGLEVNNRILRVRTLSEGPFGPRRASDGPVVVRVTSPTLRSITVNGSAQVTAQTLRADTLAISMTGPGRVAATGVTAQSVSLRTTGAGGITITGQARDVQASTSGAADIDASGLQTRGLSVNANGSGSSRFAARDTAQIVAIGAVNLTVTGTPRCTVNNVGSGTVVCGNDSSGRRNLPRN